VKDTGIFEKKKDPFVAYHNILCNFSFTALTLMSYTLLDYLHALYKHSWRGIPMMSSCHACAIDMILFEELFALTRYFGVVCIAAEAILLGFQHYLVMLGTTVIIPTALVPQMGGNNVRLQT